MASRRGYNWKARLSGGQQKLEPRNSSVNQEIVVNLGDKKGESYDDANALVLPSKRDKLKRPPPEEFQHKKLLSKKQRKKLEKIVERKQKKENRSSLISALQDVQIPAKELQAMTSLSEIQTKGLKRIFAEAGKVARKGREGLENGETARERRIRSVKGKDKLPGRDHEEMDSEGNEEDSDSGIDPNVVGLEDESFSLSSEGEEEESPNKVTPTVNGNSTLPDCSIIEQEEQQVKVRATTGNWTAEVVMPAPTPQQVIQVPDSKEVLVKRKPATHVPLYRTEEAQAARLRLPILAEEQTVMEAISENPVVVIAGETGSGKTTQLPQFLYEAGYAKNGLLIGVTEPRRVAAVSMAKRVAQETNLGDKKVSYQIRYEGNATEETEILFMTDGVLLKEIESDFLLSRYSVIIVDEAHERSVYTDILVGLLSRIVPLRHKRFYSHAPPAPPPPPPLKLIVMSATLRVADFTENSRLFPTPPPVVSVESRQFPVTVHFNKTTPEDYVAASFKKVAQIHRRLPDGGILVFLTGQQEVNQLCRKLRRTFPAQKDSKKEKESTQEDDQELNKVLKAVRESVKNKRLSKEHPKSKQKRNKKDSLGQNKVNLDDYEEAPFVSLMEMEGDEEEEEQEDDEDDDLPETDDEDLGEEFTETTSSRHAATPLHVLPLYSLLPSWRQAKVFEPPPEGTRLCIVATNVAETSLTIPGVKYVVDCGKTKRRFYDRTTGVSAFFVVWTSQASANQRTGRAGRQGPGHCYRLFSSAVFQDEMDEFSVPEIRLRPVDDLVLRMKAMNIHRVQNFPFPTAPGRELLAAAEKRLKLLGALKPVPVADGKAAPAEGTELTMITALGRTMAAFPVSPRFAKMLALSRQADFPSLMLYSVALVAAFAVPEILLERPVVEQQQQQAGGPGSEEVAVENLQRAEMKRWTDIRRKWSGGGHSHQLGDAFILLKAVGGSDWTDQDCLEDFCARNGIRHKALVEVRKLRAQLTNEANLLIPGLDLPLNPQMKPPSDQQCKLLRQIVLSGLVDQIAIRVDSFKEFETQEEKRRWKKAYRCSDLVDPVFIHPSSVLFEDRPKLVAYAEILEKNGKMTMRGVVAVEPDWLPKFAPELCCLSDPLPEPALGYDEELGIVACCCDATYGKGAWNLGQVTVEHPVNVDKFRHFAEALLLGRVLEPLAKFTCHLLSPPATVFKSWAKLQKRTDSLLDALMSRGVDSRKKLVEEFQVDAKYLLSAYLDWVPGDLHNEIVLIWPPVSKSELGEDESSSEDESKKEEEKGRRKQMRRRAVE